MVSVSVFSNVRLKYDLKVLPRLPPFYELHTFPVPVQLRHPFGGFPAVVFVGDADAIIRKSPQYG